MPPRRNRKRADTPPREVSESIDDELLQFVQDIKRSRTEPVDSNLNEIYPPNNILVNNIYVANDNAVIENDPVDKILDGNIAINNGPVNNVIEDNVHDNVSMLNDIPTAEGTSVTHVTVSVNNTDETRYTDLSVGKSTAVSLTDTVAKKDVFADKDESLGGVGHNQSRPVMISQPDLKVAVEMDTSSQEIKQPHATMTVYGDLILLVIGDTHFTTAAPKAGELLAAKTLALIDHFAADIDGVVLLGDLIDRFQMRALRRACQWVIDMSKRKPVYYVVGNHEILGPAQFLTNDHAFHGLVGVPNVYVFSQPTFQRIKGAECLFVPYVPDGRFLEAIKLIDPNLERSRNVNAVFGHQAIRGAKSLGHVSESADIWPLDFPPLILGHYHVYQRLQANVLYPGVPMQTNHSEPESSTVTLMRVREREDGERMTPLQMKLNSPIIEEPSAPNSQTRLWQFQRLRLGLPVKRTVNLTTEEYEKYNYHADPKVMSLRIIVRGSHADIDRLRMLCKSRELLKTQGVRLTFESDEDEQETARTALALAPRQSYLQQLETACATAGIVNLFHEVFSLRTEDMIK